MRLVLGLFLCAVAGCQFDTKVTAPVSCNDGRCPAGFVCRPRLNLCVAIDTNATSEAPRLTASQLLPARAKSGDTVQLTLTVSKPQLLAPVVSILEATGVRTFELVSRDGNDYRYSYVVDSTRDAEGSARVTADLVDTAGTEALGQAVGVLDFDFTSPSVLEAHFSAPRQEDDAGALLTRPTENVAVRVQVSEALAPGASLVASSTCTDAPTFTLRSSQGGLLDFAATRPGRTDCTYTLTLHGLVDAVGNARAEAPLTPRLTVDGTAPRLSNVTLLRAVDGGVAPQSTFSRQPGFDAYVFRFDVDDANATLDARLDTTAFACTCVAPTCSCAGQIAARDSEGFHTFSVTATDVAGNPSSASTQAQFDFSVPSVVESAFSAPRLGDDAGVLVVRPQETVAVRVTLSEVSVATAQLVTTSACDAGVPFTLRAAQGTLLDFVAGASGQPGCAFELVLRGATDLAGNVAPDARLSPRFTVDEQPPTLSNLALLRVALDGGLTPQTTFSHRPGFDTFQFRFEVDDPAAPLVVSLDQTRLSCACPALRCSCSGVVPAAATEGAHTFSVSARDVAGNTSTASLQAQFDFTAPGVVPSSLLATLTQPSFCPLGGVSALTQGSVGRLNFSIDEPGSVTLQAVPALLTFTLDSSTPTNFAFSARVNHAGPDAPTQVSAVATDLVGNQATAALTTMSVDTVPPAAPDVVSPTAIVYRRTPWGARDAGVSYVVIGQPGSAELDGFVQAVDGTRALVTDAGFRMTLSASDRTVVTVRTYDRACNFGPTVDVKNVEWLATLNGKQVGRTFENPHSLETREVFSTSTTQPFGATEVAPQVGLTAQGSSSWVRPNLWLPVMTNAATAFDRARNRVVVFGGASGPSAGTSNELWEYEPASNTWFNRTPASRNTNWPGPRDHAALVYDPLRDKTLLFGGLGFTDELWEWDGALGTWTNRTPSPRPSAWPSPRYSHAMAYDTARNKVMLYGGAFSASISDELWELDAAAGTWSLSLRNGLWPNGRYEHGLTYDAARNRLVAFGGLTGVGESEELMEWSATTGVWTQRKPFPRPTNWPTPRSHLGLEFDAARGTVVMFGGSFNTSTLYNEVWEWNGTPSVGTWTNRTVTPWNPSTWPGARTDHGWVFDASRGRLLLIAGADIARRDEVWEWDGAPTAGTWSNRTPNVRPPIAPSSRRNAALAYDSTRAKVMLFGGASASNISNDELWEWDGAWLNRTPTPRPTLWPSARSTHAMAFDPLRNVLVLFGGESNNELWEWSATSGTWTNRTPPMPAPSWPTLRRQNHGMAFDATRGKVVVFGGVGASGDSNEVWEWDGALGTLTNRTPTTGFVPTGRASFGMGYDGARAKVSVFGGSVSGTATSELFDWTGSNGTWTVRSTTPRAPVWPAPRSATAMAFDSNRNRFVLFGGSASGGALDDTWEWNGVTNAWVAQQPLTRPIDWPSPRSQLSMAFDAARMKTVMLGLSALSVGDDLWEWSGDSNSRPGVVAQFNFSLAGAEVGATITSVSATVVTGASSGSTPTPGARLHVTSTDALVVEATNSASTTSPTELSWQTTNSTRLGTLFEGPERRISVGVSPVGANSAGRFATVGLDWVEVLVRYRRP